MLNQIVLVGRLVKNPELKVTDNGKKMTTITLAVPRNYKNQEGEYDTDFLDCTLWTGVAENTSEYCQSGDMLGIKGRVQSRIISNDDGTKSKKTEIIAERVTFLASSATKYLFNYRLLLVNAALLCFLTWLSFALIVNNLDKKEKKGLILKIMALYSFFGFISAILDEVAYYFSYYFNDY